MDDVMPTTRPAESTSGPPELPGLIAASVWIASVTEDWPSSPAVATGRSRALMIPVVTVPWRPSGAPMATTGWPTCSVEESPIAAGVSPDASCAWTTARSVIGSRPTMVASYVVPTLVTTCIWPPLAAAATTWLLVRIREASGGGRGVRRRRRGAARGRGVVRDPKRRGAVPGPRPVHRRGRGPQRDAGTVAGAVRRADHRDRRPARHARASGLDRPRRGVPGVGPAQPRRRRPRLGRAVPAAALAGLGHARRGPRPGATRPTRSTTRSRRSTATSSSRSPSPRRRCSDRAFPDAYADHEADARTLASALSGNSPEGFSCRLGDSDDESTALKGSGLTSRADAVRRDLVARFPDQPLGGFAPGGVSTGHMEGSAHYEGRAIDLFVRPVSPAEQDPRLGDRAVPRQPG